jgi:hypothetical protein
MKQIAVPSKCDFNEFYKLLFQRYFNTVAAMLVFELFNMCFQ